MRQMISGLVAAIAVVGASAAPASACGLFQSTCGYVAPVYSDCNNGCGGGWAVWSANGSDDQPNGSDEESSGDHPVGA